jgi:hypothetical protein
MWYKKMTSIKKHITTLAVILLFIWFLLYKHVFIRNDSVQVANSIVGKVWNVINRIPYTVYFDQQQKQPNVFFTAPSFPEYVKRCHDNKKLCSVLPIQQIYADMQRLGSIQFVWGQANPNELLWLSKLLDNLSNLAPYWQYPYAFGQLLVPMPKMAEWRVEDNMIQQSREDSRLLANKWEYYTCDPQKIAAINTLSEDEFIDNIYNKKDQGSYENPCPSYERAHYSAFNSFYFRRDAEESARNYKVSSFTEGSPWLAPIMAALVYWRGGEHIKSASIWYDKFISLQQRWSQDEVIMKEMTESLQKAVFELQLQLITDADNASNKTCNNSFACLVEKWHIKASILESYNTICKKGTETNNLRCELLSIWLDNKWISLQWDLKYPLNDWFDFARSEKYESRWILWKESDVNANWTLAPNE